MFSPGINVVYMLSNFFYANKVLQYVNGHDIDFYFHLSNNLSFFF